MGCIKFESTLHENSINPAVKSVIMKFRKQSPLSAMDFTKAVVDKIKSMQLFELDSQSEIDQLSLTLEKLIKGSNLLKPDQKKVILDEYENTLFKEFNINPDGSTTPDPDLELVVENQPEDIDNESVNSDDKVLDYNVDKIYGKTARVKEYMLNQFRISITECSLVNFRKRKLIKSTRDLNQAIADYKNELFKKLFDYLKKEKENEGVTFDSQLLDYIYNEAGIPNIDNMQKIMKMADEVLYNLDKDTLSSAYISKSIHPYNKQLVEAFNAYVLLSSGNFDKILQKLMGKDFVIKDVYKNTETAVHNDKYKFQSANNYRKSWKNSENIDAITEIGKISKLLIEQTPIIDPATGLIKEDRFLTMRQFLYTMNKFNDSEFIRKFPPRLRRLAINFNSAPNYYLQKMLDIIMSPDFNTVHRVFTNSDMITLKSIYERFYNSRRPDSLYSIMLNTYQNSTASTKYDLLEVISGTVNRTNSSKYVQYGVDRETSDLESYEIAQSNSVRKRITYENDMTDTNRDRIDRKELLDTYNVKIANATTGDISFDLSDGKNTYTFTFVKSGKSGAKLLATLNGQSVSMASIIQEPSFSDLKNFYERTPSQETIMAVSKKEVQLYRALVKFVDDFLNIGFLSGNVDLLEAYKSAYEADNLQYLTDKLMYMAADAAFINVIYNEFENQTEIDTIGEFAKTYKFYDDLPDNTTWKKYYDSKADVLKVINVELDPLNKLATAEQMLSGEMYKTVTKNAEGNNVPVNRISNLANQTLYYLHTRVLNNPESSIRGNIFAVTTTKENGESTYHNESNLLGVNIKQDAISRNGVKKSASNFTEAEHAYTSIMYDFYQYLVGQSDSRYSREGDSDIKFVQVQPTVYSDKETFYMWRVGTKYTLIGPDGKTYKIDLGSSKTTPELLNKAIKDTIGKQYKDTQAKVFRDYRQVLSSNILGLSDPNNKLLQDLRIYAEESGLQGLLNAYNSIVSKYDKLTSENAKILEKNLEIQALNDQHAKEMAEANAMGDFMTWYDSIDPLPLKSLSDLLSDQEVVALLTVLPISTYNTISYAEGITSIENLHFNKGIKINGETCVKPNHLLLYNATRLYSNDSLYDKQMLRERKRFAKDLISFNISFPLVYSDGKTNQVLEGAIKKYGGSNFDTNWVNSQTKELIIAKRDGVPVTRLNPIEDIRDTSTLELNPLLERYFLSDFLMSENLRILTTGFELAHPNKSKAGDELTIENAELEEASRAGAQYKRNVIITGTKQQFQQGGLLGTPPTMKVAVMSDIPATVYNINGDIKDDLDAHDGGAFNNCLWAGLENLSLQDQAVGEDRKPIGHGFTSYGTAWLLKFATFSQYNERLRKSQFAPVNMLDMHRKMNSIPWESVNDGRPVDITKNIFGRQMDLIDVTDGERLFFSASNSINSFNLQGIDTSLVDVELHDKPWKSDPSKTNKSLRLYLKDNHVLDGKNESYFELVKDNESGYYSVHFKTGNADTKEIYGTTKEQRSILFQQLLNAIPQGAKFSTYGNISEGGLKALEKLGKTSKKIEVRSEGVFDREGNPITIDIYQKGKIPGNKHYEILSIEATGNPNEYIRTIREVDINGNAIGSKIAEPPITINTNYALHQALGGVQSESLVQEELTYGDASIYATTAYINNVGYYDANIGGYPSQKNTYQPLKYAMYSYLANKTTMKVGVQNQNGIEAWTDPNVELKYMEVETDGIGIQMDADHIVTDPEHQSTMTEPSQIISALEANGTVHDISKQAYRDLGKVALSAVADIHDAIKTFIESDYSPEGKSEIYEIVARQMVKELTKDGKNLGLSQSIVAKVKEQLGKRNKNHAEDEFKIPFSDPSIFSKALSSFTSAINKKAVKRKFFGMGAVMAPCYNIMMNFNIPFTDNNGTRILDMSYDDIYKAAANKGLTPREYLDDLQNNVETAKNEDGTFKYLNTIDKLKPNDIIRVADIDGNLILDETGNPLEFNLQNPIDYFRLKPENGIPPYTHFFPVVSKPQNLKPIDINWRTPDGKQYTLYDLPQVRYAFSERSKYSRKNPIPKTLDLQIQKGINDALALLDKGLMTTNVQDKTTKLFDYNGTKYLVKPIDKATFISNPAEMIVSKIYAERFNLGPNDTLNDVVSQGALFFSNKYEKYHKPKTQNYDICFTRGNGKHTYIAFQNSGVLKNLSANKDTDSENYVRKGDNLYRVDEDGNIIYRAGAYDEAGNLTMLVESYNTTDSNSLEEVLVVKNIETVLELYDSKTYDSIILNKRAEPVKDTIYDLIRKGAEERQGEFVNMAKSLTDDMQYSQYVKGLETYKAERIAKLAEKKFSSFQKSLEYIVGRIPAQTLQSFMKMKAVQFSDSDKNVVYVTAWQTWLQGSDY